MGGGGRAEGEAEAESPLSREPNPRTPGPQDHDLIQSQMLNQLSHPGAPGILFLGVKLILVFQYVILERSQASKLIRKC